MATVEIGKLEEILAKADSLFVPFASKSILEAEVVVKEIWGEYPPQPPRDRAKTFNTYVRGRGNYPKSAFVAAKNEPGGYKTKKVKAGTVKLTSQQMHTRFKTEVNGMEGTLLNTASYSGYVIGNESEDPKQVGYHAATGWASTEKSIAEAMPQIEQIAQDAADKFVNSLFGG